MGGGRYDKMVGQFDGQNTAATGFGLGYATLLLLLKDRGIMPKVEEGIDYYVKQIRHPYLSSWGHVTPEKKTKLYIILAHHLKRILDE